MFDLDLNSYIEEMIYELIPNIRKHGDKLNFKCPLCGDGKKKTSHRGWYYLKTASVFCWNAGCPANSGMSGFKFLSLLTGKSVSEIKTELIKRAGSFNSVLSTSQNNSSTDINILNPYKKINNLSVNENILDDNWTEELPKIVTDTLNKRKILKAPFLNDMKFYYNKKSKRLVIPWSKEYWQERALFKYQEQSEGKYLFPTKEGIQKPIFGINNINSNYKNIFLLEGVFDSIWIKNGLAVGSLKLSNHQHELLKPYEKEYNIIYFMDNQWVDNSSKNETIKLLKLNPFQKIFIWPKKLEKFKDVNESIIYSDKFIKLWSDENFLSSRIFNGVTGLLEMNN